MSTLTTAVFTDTVEGHEALIAHLMEHRRLSRLKAVALMNGKPDVLRRGAYARSDIETVAEELFVKD